MASQKIIPFNVNKVVHKIRCPRCTARQFDGRTDWRAVALRDALIVIKCWRCDLVQGYTPEDHKEHHGKESSPEARQWETLPEFEE